MILWGGGGIQNGLYENVYAIDGPGTNYVSGTAMNLTNITDCTFKQVVGITSNPSPTAGGICSDFGSTSCSFIDCYSQGFKFGFVFSSSTSQAAQSWLDFVNPTVVSAQYNGMFFVSASGLGPSHLSIRNPRIISWDTAANGSQGIDLQGAQHFSITGGGFGANTYGEYPIRLDTDGTNPCNFGMIENVDFSASTLAILYSSVGSSIRVKSNLGYNPTGPQTAPAVPASGTALTNPFPFDATVYISGGTVSAVAVGGTATGLTSGQFFVPAGETITLTYSAAPTWTWFGN